MISGNSCLIYSIIRKRQIFYQLINVPKSDNEIREILTRHGSNAHFEELLSETDEELEELEIDDDELGKPEAVAATTVAVGVPVKLPCGDGVNGDALDKSAPDTSDEVSVPFLSSQSLIFCK